MPTPVYTSGMRPQDMMYFSTETRGIYIDTINVPEGRRKLDEKTVQQIYESIAVVGLINPISIRVNPMTELGYTLVTGAHRLEAWMRHWRDDDADLDDRSHQKRWAENPSTIYPEDMTDEQMELIEILENLERKELTPKQRKEQAIRLGVLMSAKGANGTCGAKRTQGGGSQKGLFAQWCEAAKIPKKTTNNWWKQYTEAEGITCTPAKADETQQSAFFTWHKEEAERPKPQPKTPTQQPQEDADKDADAKAPDDSVECDPGTGDPVKKPLPRPSDIVPDLADMIEETRKVDLDKAINSLSPAQKGAVTRLFNAAIKNEIREQVRVKEIQLDAAIKKYGGRINGKTEDIKRMRACLHPDRPERTPVQLNNASQSFQRLLGEAS